LPRTLSPGAGEEDRVANIQKQFEEFNGKIRLGKFEENSTLREKRDIIRDKLRERLPGIFDKYREKRLAPKFRDQGSYEMDTGVRPLNGDFDIDQGLYFEISTDDYDPVILKKRVHEALVGHTKDVCIRRPCVTVQYQRKGEPTYHVDLAVYANANADGKARLAVGRESTSLAEREWQISDPKGLTDTIFGKYKEADRAQLRRVVRYLKRWRDLKFSVDGNAAPLGISLTVLAYNHLEPTYTDQVAGKADDLSALRKLVKAILGRFTDKFDWNALRNVRDLEVSLPVEPWNDLFEQMSYKQIEEFEEKLKKLRDSLDSAEEAADPVDACKALRKVFGEDFPVPTKEETAKQHSRAIVSSSSSA
jgi:hypothetical protein